MSESLVEPTRRFIDVVTAGLEAVSVGVEGVRADRWRQDAALEAFNLVCGLVSIDRRVSDDELWEVLAAFRPLLETRLAGATPEALRSSGLVDAQRYFAAVPSALFEVLLTADALAGSAHARRYYDHAVKIAFAVAAIDLHTSEVELAAIERFRGMLLAAIKEMESERAPAGVPARPQVALVPEPAAEDTPLRPIDELLAEMDELIASTPGLRSRFPKSIHFPDYTTDELLAIFDSLGERGGYHLDAGGRAAVRLWLDAAPRDRGFGNGRTARNLFEHAVATQATRLVVIERPTDEQLTTLVGDDIPAPGTGPVTVTRPAVGTV